MHQAVSRCGSLIFARGRNLTNFKGGKRVFAAQSTYDRNELSSSINILAKAGASYRLYVPQRSRH